MVLFSLYGERERDLEWDLVRDLCRGGDRVSFNEAGDPGAEDGLALVGRSTLVPLRGGCDAVAFVSGPDSTISPSEGTDGDLDLGRDMFTFEGFKRHVCTVLFSWVHFTQLLE